MSDLHAQLLRWFEPGSDRGDLEDAIAHGEAALRAVVEVHAPIPCRCTDNAQHTICAGCPGHELAERCRTLRSVAAGLGIEP